MTGSIVAPDGITWQYGAELLLNYEDTENARRSYPRTFVKSLERVAFSIVLADEICLTAAFPRGDRADEPAGETLKEVVAKNMNVKADGTGKTSPHTNEELLGTGRKSEIKSDLALLDKAVLVDVDRAFRDWLVREFDLYFGNHNSVRDDRVSPGDYVFDAPHYVRDRELLNAVPSSFLRKMASYANRPAIARLGRKQAREEFIRRMTATHIARYHQYGQLVGSQVRTGFQRIPHWTRELVVAARPGQNAGRNEILELLMPVFLPEALKKARGERRAVLEAIFDLRNDPGWTSLRNTLSELWSSKTEDKRRSKKEERLAREMNRIIGNKSPELREALRFPVEIYPLIGVAEVDFVAAAVVVGAFAFDRLTDARKPWRGPLKALYRDDREYTRLLRSAFRELDSGTST